MLRENPRRNSSLFVGELMDREYVKQCWKCMHYWKSEDHLRKSGKPSTRCPKCNSYQTVDTRLIITRIQAREDLLMLTGGQYPKRFCPVTSIEETSGTIVSEIVEGRNRLALIGIGRGFENAKHGHKAYLWVAGKGLLMTTSYVERQSMKGAVAWCPKNARIFIGGLGLGLILIYLAKSRKPKSVTVCEIDPLVIRLVYPKVKAWFDEHYPDFPLEVIQGDALVEVQKPPSYDWVFMDIWKSASSYGSLVLNGEHTYGNKSIPIVLKAEAVAKKNLTPNGRVTCWMKREIFKRAPGRTKKMCVELTEEGLIKL